MFVYQNNLRKLHNRRRLPGVLLYMNANCSVIPAYTKFGRCVEPMVRRCRRSSVKMDPFDVSVAFTQRAPNLGVLLACLNYCLVTTASYASRAPGIHVFTNKFVLQIGAICQSVSRTDKKLQIIDNVSILLNACYMDGLLRSKKQTKVGTVSTSH